MKYLVNGALKSAKGGNPQNILLIGERGIGKTSFLLTAKIISSDSSDFTGIKLNFLPVYISINNKMTAISFAKNIQITLERELRKSKNKAILIKDIWSFVQRIEIAGTKIGSNTDTKDQNEVFDNVIYSLIDSIKLIQKDDLDYKKDGIILFLDEIDNANAELDIGVFVKQLTEKMAFENANNLLIIAAGLPNAIDILRISHPSSIRVFNIIPLKPLSINECKEVISRGLEEANSKNEYKVIINENILSLLAAISEGYPHFIQQIGYCAYDIDVDNIIDENDAQKGIIKAIDLIGERYYKELYYGKVKEDSYREILRIMSEKLDSWVTKDDIRKKFSGKETSLTNALAAMSKKSVIIKNQEKNGEYKLQWKGFALWISMITSAASVTNQSNSA